MLVKKNKAPLIPSVKMLAKEGLGKKSTQSELILKLIIS